MSYDINLSITLPYWYAIYRTLSLLFHSSLASFSITYMFKASLVCHQFIKFCCCSAPMYCTRTSTAFMYMNFKILGLPGELLASSSLIHFVFHCLLHASRPFCTVATVQNPCRQIASINHPLSVCLVVAVMLYVLLLRCFHILVHNNYGFL